MSFPASPSNGQLATVNNITYVYASASNSWTRSASANITVGNGSVSSTSTTSGALVVQGGAGVTGALYVGSLNTSNAQITGGTLTASTLSGTIPSTVLGNSTHYIGTTAITLNRASGSQSLTGITSIDGSAATVTTAAQPAITSVGTLTSLKVNGGPIVGGAGTYTTFSSTVGDIILNSGATDTPGVHFYYGNNTNFGIDVANSLLRFVGNLDETGGTVLASLSASGNLTATNFLGIASSAKYADLAEIYTSDKEYLPGTVVVFGGTKEITATTKTHDTRVAGVISTNPAYLMNSEALGLPVAFTGRVPCLVKGPVVKGDVLVTSAHERYAERLDEKLYSPGCILGKALGEVADREFATIEVVVGRF